MNKIFNRENKLPLLLLLPALLLMGLAVNAQFTTSAPPTLSVTTASSSAPIPYNGNFYGGFFTSTLSHIDTTGAGFFTSTLESTDTSAVGNFAIANLTDVEIATNAIASWPTSAHTKGGAAIVNSNATLYLLQSSPGSQVWAATNKIGQ